MLVLLSSSRSRSIQRGRALRARLPAAMHPKPLVGIFPHVVLNHLGEQLRVGDDVGFQIAASDQFESRIEAQPVLAEGLIPEGETRYHRRIGTQRNTGQTASRACGDSKKIN